MTIADDADERFRATTGAPLNLMRDRAFACHLQGRTAEAAMLYGILIDAAPGDFQVLAMSGMLAAQTGQTLRAAELLQRAIALNPGSPQAHNNLGIVFTTLRRYPEAVASFARAIALDAAYAEAYSNRGVALTHLKRWDEALASHDVAIQLQPLAAASHSNRGGLLRMMRRLGEALRSCEQALALAPGNAQALVNHSQVLCDLHRPQEALASVERALVSHPDLPDALVAQGCSRHLLGDYAQALRCFDRALALEPGHTEALCQRGAALCALGRCAEALISCEQAIALDAQLVPARVHRGMALAGLGRHAAALRALDQAIELDAGHAVAHYNRARALEQLQRFDEALAAYDRGIALGPEQPEAYVSKSMCLLLLGRFDEGWPLYEWRRRRGPAAAARLFAPPQPRWQRGGEIRGRTLFLHWEQGYGDTIQFCRYAKLAEESGARVLLNVQPALSRLMRSLSPSIEILADGDVAAAADYECPIMSLPGAFGADRDAIPNRVPYLAAEPERIARWRPRIGSAGFKVGICWQGAPGRIDLGRSFPLAMFRRIAAQPGVRLISLQKHHGTAQLAELPPDMIVETLDEDFDAGPDAFLDTAAVMQHLDLIITSDTSIAHLAGALARPTWLALPHVPEWRWLLGRDDSPWYPTLRLFRQHDAGNWDGVFTEIHADLRILLTEFAA